MATTAQIEAVVDAVIAAFEGNPALWQAFLTRSKLETELAQIESEIRQETATMNTDQDAHQATLNDLNDQRLAKIAEIDALG